MTDERKAIEAAQDALCTLKQAMRTIQDINTKSSNLEAANAAMGLRGELIVWHSNATAMMHAYFPEFASEIQTRGGGGR
jgi:hypothetical protein